MNASQVHFLRVRAEFFYASDNAAFRGFTRACGATLHRLRRIRLARYERLPELQYYQAMDWWNQNGLDAKTVRGEPITFPTPQ